ncbi:MAG: FHA domain-containing protein [Bacteriovoracaceae bacterium]|nr:FHA domain-containing protein [Bacteriovoracaceae bacterium]
MKLVAYKNNKVVSQFELDGGSVSEGQEVFIGRSDDCHLVINDPQISREHAVLLFQKGKWKVKRLTDVGTILMNNKSIQEQEISSNEDFNLGAYSIHLENEVAAPAVNEDITNIIAESIPEQPELVHEPMVANEPATNIISEAAPESTETVTETTEEPSTLENDDVAPIDDSFASDNNLSDPGSLTNEVTESQPENTEAPATDFSMDSNNIAPMENTLNENTQSNVEADGTQVIKSFSSFELQIFGEHAPYDRYVIEKDEIFIGRNQQKCQIVLDDTEVSGVNSVLRKVGFSLVLEDLKSTNGTILNGSRINKAELSEGDEFLIGSTSFTVKVKSDLLENESETLMPIEESAPIEAMPVAAAATTAGQAPVADPFATVGTVKGNESILKDPAKRKKLMYGIVAVLLVWVLFDEEKPPAPQPTPADQQKAADATAAKPSTPDPTTPQAKQLSQEEREFVEATYNVAKAYIEKGEYAKGLNELDKIKLIDENYKLTQTLYSYAKEGLTKLEELEKKEKREKLRKLREKEIGELFAKAQEAYERKDINVAEQYINKIIEIDPENTKSQELKLSIDAFKKDLDEKRRIEEEIKNKRETMVASLKPGKNFYLKKEWYKAILKLEEFLAKDGMDEDLIKEGTTMLEESKTSLNQITSPLLGKARSLKEGQDLKGAYETYNELLKYDPTSTEALNEMAAIREELENRAKKVYREAIISESLSLFDDAKEKFQEVQQISPVEGEYYIKATEKLKEYLE